MAILTIPEKIMEEKQEYTDHDRLFKELIQTFFQEFIEAFFRKYTTELTFLQ